MIFAALGFILALLAVVFVVQLVMSFFGMVLTEDQMIEWCAFIALVAGIWKWVEGGVFLEGFCLCLFIFFAFMIILSKMYDW